MGLFRFTLCILLLPFVHGTDLSVSTHDMDIKLHEKQYFTIRVTNVTSKYNFSFNVQHSDIILVKPKDLVISQNVNVAISVEAIGAGHSEISIANLTDLKIKSDEVFVRVTVYKNDILDYTSLTIGWLYFIAWSISFYPQIYSNYKRKSVVGLNFDFVVLNIVGFTLYSLFNVGLYAIPEIKDEYADRYPRGLNPVQINDIVFSLHATIATLATIYQCFLYERNGQTVSFITRILLGLFGFIVLISAILSGVKLLHWLDFLYYCSYIKLSITLIKYVPQAYMNYQRQSTVGWSIGNIILDFTGGILSVLQMLINAFNYDDWISIFGDPTKFGLGFFSVLFDIFFMIQHYILYKHSNYEEN